MENTSTNKRVIKQVKRYFYPIDLKLSWVVAAGRVGRDSNHKRGAGDTRSQYWLGSGKETKNEGFLASN
jgi:hypothetical protein